MVKKWMGRTKNQQMSITTFNSPCLLHNGELRERLRILSSALARLARSHRPALSLLDWIAIIPHPAKMNIKEFWLKPCQTP